MRRSARSKLSTLHLVAGTESTGDQPGEQATFVENENAHHEPSVARSKQEAFHVTERTADLRRFSPSRFAILEPSPFANARRTGR